MITTEQIKELRDSTGISVMQCKKALEEAGGDIEKALAILKKKSGELAMKRKDKTFGAGIVQAYVHATLKVASLVELVCETDFVSGNDEFKALARDIAMHITASNPIEESVLLGQPFIKNPDVTVESLILAASQKFGEKIAVARFTRFAVLEK
ncbi:MAG: elongation factor Ts [Candidatus Taylorbacteria bacterium]|nr:elongation factor Ts [Candidatus Taylorbacteria bacterium]